MAPGRKRGAKGGGSGGEGGGGGGGGGRVGPKSKTQLNLGDLVLAKVKGFPAWPAKISRPEDWERAPDPKKYFVQFFGTEEIAFVAPADIQAFTSEAKNKLSTRCRGKTVKYFAQAVKEISEEFEQLQRRSSSCLRDDKSQLAVVGHVLSADGLIDDAVGADLKEGRGTEGDHGSGQEHCCQRQGVTNSKDIKSCASEYGNGDSSKRNKFPDEGAKLVKKEVLSTSSSGDHSFHKEISCVMRVEECSLRRMSHEEGSKVSQNCRPHTAEEGCAASLSLEHEEYPNVAEDLSNGHRPTLAAGSKRKDESSYEMHNISGRAPTSLPCHGSGSNVDLPLSNQQSGGKQSSQNVMKRNDHGKEVKELLKDRKNFEAKNKPEMEVEESFVDKVQFSSKRGGEGKQTSQSNEASHPAKRSKSFDVTDTSKVLPQSRKVESQLLDDKMVDADIKKSVSRGKAENHTSMNSLSTTIDSNLSGDEDVLPPSKRRRRALEAMSTSSASFSESRIGRSSATLKNDISRRRAVRLCDEEEEEEPKTPVHGGYAKRVLATSHGPISTKRGDICSSFSDQFGKRGSGTPEGQSSKKSVPSVEQLVDYLSPNSHQVEEKRHGKATTFHISSSPGKLESEKVSFMESKPVPVSPRRSPLSVSDIKSVIDPQKSNKLLGKIPGNMHQTKTPSASKGPGATFESLSSSVNQLNGRIKPEISADRNKSTPKSHSKTNDLTLPAGNLMESHFLHGERSEDGRDDKLGSSIDQRTLDSVVSMKHLIAAAQAKKRQAHLQNFNDNPHFLLALNTDEQVRSPSPPVAQPMGSSNVAPPDVQGFLSHSSVASPPSDVYQASSINQHDGDEFVERRESCGHHIAGGSLSGGTEAAVARDAFEGMIETLSRTKESIGRATRLAIDCAKYGIANEVVELLIRKLESEPSFHHKVDLFFLVDSITQCSHSHKGIAGASYIPAVQAALPRLLVAAAPPGSGARENRRQCLKVLRLWLERKILPDSLLRRYMDDIGIVNDDTSSGLSLRRPSRAERAIDDPIREMEGMLVDEYGSNATFQLPGFFSSRVFEEEEEEEEEAIEHNSVKEAANRSPLQHTPAAGDVDSYSFTPNERRHHILEDVDGELEMEDVSGHQKDERPSMIGDAFGTDPSHLSSIKIVQSASDIAFELPPLPEGSPPLPPDSPPETPALPFSPPPSPLQPPMPSSPAPPPPPPPLLHPHAIPPPSVGPSLVLPPQTSLPPQPSMSSQHIHPLPSSNLASTVVAYQQGSVLPEIGGNPNGNPFTQTAGNTSHGPPVDASVRNEMFAQQASCCVPVGVGSSQESSGYNSSRSFEYGHNSVYTNSLVCQPSMQFQPGCVPFAQRPLPPNPPPQGTPNHFSYPVPAIRQHPPAVQHHPPAVQHALSATHHPPSHPYPPFSVPNFADGLRHFAADEQWRIRPNELNADQLVVWKHGFSMPPPDRPLVGAASFQPSVLNTYQGGTSVPGHGVNNMIPARPDMSTFGWRPA